MKALVLNQNSFNIEVVDRPVISPWEVLVKVNFAALNHRDQWIRDGQYAGIQYPAILGSDGMGMVEEVGSSVDDEWLGKEVIINPNIDWGNDPTNQDMKKYQILGMPSSGTLAEYIKVNVDRLHEKPAFLSSSEAAALPLAGLTAFNALFNKGHASADKDILISGVGGGVAQFAFQFGLAIGARVWVTSSKEEVLSACMDMGAAGRINYHRPDFHKTLKKESGGFDLIIDSSGGDGMNALLSTLNPNGRFVFYGATRGIPNGLNLRMVFWKQLQILGSTMGSDDDFSRMLDFVNKHQLHPIIDKVYALDDAVDAFDRMKAGVQFGKIVISISK